MGENHLRGGGSYGETLSAPPCVRGIAGCHRDAGARSQGSRNAAENAIRWDSGDLCLVDVDDTYDMEVDLFCAGDGSAWVKVRVPGVTDSVTRDRERRGRLQREATHVR